MSAPWLAQQIATGCPCRSFLPIKDRGGNFGPLSFLISTGATFQIINGGNPPNSPARTATFNGGNPGNSPARTLILQGSISSGLVTHQRRSLTV